MTDQPAETPVGRMLPSLPTARIETLADGVFAIVMTLLVFGLVVPTQEQVDAFGLPGALLLMLPNLFAYVVSFILLGIFWIGHHNQFFYIRRSDRRLLWINILFMMFVALIPFSTSLLSRYSFTYLPTVIYDINMILVGLTLYWHWSYGTRDNHLCGAPLDPVVKRIVNQRILAAPLLYTMDIFLSFINHELGVILCIVIPLLYAFPPRLDHIFHRPEMHR